MKKDTELLCPVCNKLWVFECECDAIESRGIYFYEMHEARYWAMYYRKQYFEMMAERDTLQNQLDKIPRGHLIEKIHELEEQLAAALEAKEKVEKEAEYLGKALHLLFGDENYNYASDS